MNDSLEQMSALERVHFFAEEMRAAEAREARERVGPPVCANGHLLTPETVKAEDFGYDCKSCGYVRFIYRKSIGEYD
jgi:hypothetical protein